jgi:hypothetical protein
MVENGAIAVALVLSDVSEKDGPWWPSFFWVSNNIGFFLADSKAS